MHNSHRSVQSASSRSIIVELGIHRSRSTLRESRLLPRSAPLHPYAGWDRMRRETSQRDNTSLDEQTRPFGSGSSSDSTRKLSPLLRGLDPQRRQSSVACEVIRWRASYQRSSFVCGEAASCCAERRADHRLIRDVAVHRRGGTCVRCVRYRQNSGAVCRESESDPSSDLALNGAERQPARHVYNHG